MRPLRTWHFQQKWGPVLRFENATAKTGIFSKSGDRFCGSKMRRHGSGRRGIRRRKSPESGHKKTAAKAAVDL
jgi:hypothetical protein